MNELYIVEYESPDGKKGRVLTNEENGPCVVELYRTLAEAETVANEMRDAYSYTGLKYSVVQVGKEWQ